MHKSFLTNFISKYNFSGIEQVLWNFKDNTISVPFMVDDSSMIGEVKYFNFPIDTLNNEQIGIYRTKELLKLLSVLEDDIKDMSLKMVNDKAISIAFSDQVTKINYALSDPAIIPKAKRAKNPPSEDEYELSIKIDDEFRTKFQKAISALPDEDEVILKKIDEKYYLIIGEKDVNTDVIKLQVELSKHNSDIDAVNFSGPVFANVLSANKGFDTEFSICSQGLGRIQFKNDEYEAVYYFAIKENE